MTPAQIAERLAVSRMVDNAAELAARLAAIPGAPGFAVAFERFEGQTHTNVPWTALNPMLDFALGADRERGFSPRPAIAAAGPG